MDNKTDNTPKENLVGKPQIALPIFRYIANIAFPFLSSGDVKIYLPKEIVSCFEKAGFKKENVLIKDKIQLIEMSKI